MIINSSKFLFNHYTRKFDCVVIMLPEKQMVSDGPVLISVGKVHGPPILYQLLNRLKEVSKYKRERYLNLKKKSIFIFHIYSIIYTKKNF